MTKHCMDYRKEITKNRAFWESVLGEELCKKLPVDQAFKEEGQMKVELSVLEKLYQEELSNEKGWEAYCLPGLFHIFYGFFGKIAVRYVGINKMGEVENPKDIILANLYPAVSWIPLRVLIQDIHELKDKGELRGRDSHKEYEDYQRRFLGRRDYIKKLCEKYPEMKRLMFRQILYVVHEIKQILQAVEQDRDILFYGFLDGKKFNKIINIKCGASDAHHEGLTVAEVCLDNQKTLIYKPRSLWKEQVFLQLYANFCEELGVPMRTVAVLDRTAYSWEEYVEIRECETEQEVKNYFKRLGILLFLCYLTDAGDMHGENILASGEYPVPIDLETVPGYSPYGDTETAESMVWESIRHSVMKTGILPEPIWNEKGKGAILNAVNRGGLIRTPFKIPVLCGGESSDVRIEYQYGKRELPNSIPAWKGETVNPVLYTTNLVWGFCEAYMLFLAQKEKYVSQLSELFQGKSRCLFRHTQQYHMYLQSSYYPELLESTTKRSLFLHVLDRNAPYQELLPYERKSLFLMNIPAFYFQCGGRTAVDGEGREYPEFLDASLEENWMKKLERVSMQDMERQAAFIEYAMELLNVRSYMRRKTEAHLSKHETAGTKSRIRRQIDKIAARICSQAFIKGKTDIEFCVICPGRRGAEEFAPSGMYLYHGLAGIAVFLAAAVKTESCDLYEYVLRMITEKLFRYTEQLCRQADTSNLSAGGAFEGDGSLITAYLMLYRITKEEKYLDYAQLHAGLVKKLWQKENSMDYLSGLAGLAIVFCRLYQQTKQGEHLKEAVMMGEKIWDNCETMEHGAGWRLKKEAPPLAGLAHGNAGLLMAFGNLLEQTGNAEYNERIDKLLEYEDSLLVHGNWLDLRNPEGKRICNNAWCHGAAGILLSRLQLKRAGYFDSADIVERDIQYCKAIFLESDELQDLCLCHGLCGLYQVLCYYLKKREDAELEQERIRLGQSILTQVENRKTSAREGCNFALMTGITGIGLTLYFMQQNF